MKLSIFILLALAFTACGSEKRYEEYDEKDFYEVQGIINSASPNSDPFDSPTIKNIRFSYFLDRSTPKIGNEKNLNMFEAKSGYPLIVLVHKNDEDVSFYGRVGILDSLNPDEQNFLRGHLQNKLNESREE